VSKRQQKFSATVLVYISPKIQQRYPANSGNIYQQKRQQRSPKAAYEFCPQCWYLTAEKDSKGSLLLQVKQSCQSHLGKLIQEQNFMVDFCK
jgi:hypothetical protein